MLLLSMVARGLAVLGSDEHPPPRAALRALVSTIPTTGLHATNGEDLVSLQPNEAVLPIARVVVPVGAAASGLQEAASAGGNGAPAPASIGTEPEPRLRGRAIVVGYTHREAASPRRGSGSVSMRSSRPANRRSTIGF